MVCRKSILIGNFIAAFLVAALIGPRFAGAAEIFSLDESIAFGLKHSPVLKEGEIKVDQADMDIKSQRGQFLPNITTGYAYNQVFSEYRSGYEESDFLDQENNTLSLRVNQPLFAGFENKNRFDRAKLGKAYQATQLDLQRLDLVYQIKTLFYEILKIKYDLSTIAQRIKRLESDLEVARAFSDNRIAPYVYVLQAEADLEEAKQNLWQSQTLLFKNSARLKSLVGLSRDQAMVEFDDRFDVPIDPVAQDLDACMDRALSHRPEMLLFNLQTRMAKKDADIQKGQYYPRVDLDFGIYDTDKEYDGLSSYDYHTDYWTVGVNVRMNLFDGGTAYYQKKRYLLEMDRIATEKTKLKMEIEEAVGVAFNSLKEARKRLVSMEKGLAASQESYNRQKKRFNARIGTISEVLDAQSMLARAESIKSQTLLDCRIYMAQLYHAMGLGQSPSDPSAPGPSGSGQIKPEMDK